MNLLDHKSGRGLITFAFYFAEGAPIGFIWWALPTLLRKNGVELGTIGMLTAILTLPWVFKFLWAPLIDVLRSPRFGFTKWITISQVLMCITLVPLMFIPISESIFWFGLSLLLHSICAATQDVSIDAMVINLVASKERGMLNGYMQAGMLLGRSLFGGGALILVPKLGLPIVVAIMILVILSVLSLLFFVKEPEVNGTKEEQFLQFKNSLKETFVTKQTWYTIAFALTAAAAFEVTGAMLGPFLTDKHVDTDSIGYFFGIPVVLSMLLGGLTGGFLSDKLKRKTSVAFFLIGITAMVSSISLMVILHQPVSDFLWMILFGGMYFFTGMFTTASYALFMDVTNPKLGATQFSTFMAATNGCEAWVVWAGGLLASSYNYSTAFLVMCLVSVMSLFFLARIKVA